MTTKHTFDFDVAELDVPTFTAMHGLMLKHGITLRTINMCGPGGGNPQVIATAADDGAARCFLAEFFGDLDY